MKDTATTQLGNSQFKTLDEVDNFVRSFGFTFGYIGNLERWGDDRGWYVFARDKSFYLGSTECWLSNFNDAVDSGRFAKWADRAANF